MNVLDLFSGIGGFSLGLERAGFSTVAFCEIEPYCRAVLGKHWPGVPCYEDVRELTAERLAADGIAVDVICGGFPCQDISFAGAGAGLSGERSGLWREYARLVREIRPRFVIVENVSALLSRGLGEVLGDLAEIGYDAQWHCIPASAVGAPHRRDRIWIVAYPRSEQHEGRGLEIQGETAKEFPAPDAHGQGQHDGAVNAEVGRSSKHMGHSTCTRSQRPWDEPEKIGGEIARQLELAGQGIGRQWFSEPDLGRVANGVPSRVDRLKSLGNAVVPQIPEIIGRAILASRSAA